MTATPNRVQPGVPSGGQFAPTEHAEADIELPDAPAPKLALGTAVTRHDYVTGKPIQDGHILGPAQMTRDSDGSEPYEVYPVQAAGGRGLAGWWTTRSIQLTENPQPPTWPIDAEGSPARRMRDALSDDTVFYVESVDTHDGVTDIAARCPGGRYTVRIGNGRYEIVEHPPTGAPSFVHASGTYDNETEGYRDCARDLEGIRVCACGADYYEEDETGYDADGNGDNRCPNCAQDDVRSARSMYRSLMLRDAAPSLDQQHADGVHEGKPMPGCRRCDDIVYGDA